MPAISGKSKKTIAKELSSLGVHLSTHEGEHKVNFHGHDDKTAYYTDDLHDAHQTGMHMGRSAYAAGLRAAKGFRNLAHKESSRADKS